MNKLNIAMIHPHVTTLGPGVRFGIWVQGCPFNCKGCLVPEWREFKIAHLISVRDLASYILSMPIDGITISGGEPFLQASNLAKLLKIIKDNRGEINVIVYTGFNYKDLTWNSAKEFLSHIDVLIAGPYIEKLNNGKGLRGSTNQEIIFLTERLRNYEDYFYNTPRRLEVRLHKDSIFLIGIPDQRFSTLWNNLFPKSGTRK